jgi:hypothetical protein
MLKIVLFDYAQVLAFSFIITFLPLYYVAIAFTKLRTLQVSLFVVHWTGVAVILCMLAHIGKWCSRQWRDNKFPIWNTLFHKRRRFVVNPSAIINNTFVIRSFQNVELSYEVTDDYASYLTGITIEEVYRDYPFKWYAIFHFSQQPKNGTMTVMTI